MREASGRDGIHCGNLVGGVDRRDEFNEGGLTKIKEQLREGMRGSDTQRRWNLGRF